MRVKVLAMKQSRDNLEDESKVPLYLTVETLWLKRKLERTVYVLQYVPVRNLIGEIINI